MSNQIHIIQNAITTTISEIFRGDFRRICEVKKAVLHLEAIYFCHGTCYLLKRENMPIKDQLALYQRIELIPQSTTEFFENNRECIINNGTITTPRDGSWFLPWERKTARPMFLTHVGTRAGDYWQSKKSFRYWRLARKQGMKNLLKTRAA